MNSFFQNKTAKRGETDVPRVKKIWLGPNTLVLESDEEPDPNYIPPPSVASTSKEDEAAEALRQEIKALQQEIEGVRGEVVELRKQNEALQRRIMEEKNMWERRERQSKTAAPPPNGNRELLL